MVAGGDVRVQHLEERDPHDRLLERRDPVHAPPVRVALDLRVEVLGVVVGGVGQRAREVRGVALEHVLDLTAGDVVLVEGEDGGAPLVAASGHGVRSLRLRQLTGWLLGLYARDMYSPERVSTFTRCRRRRTAAHGWWRRSRAWRACCRRRTRCRP